MTNDLAEPDGDQLVRRRAAWVLVVVGLIAVIGISAIVLLTGTPGESPASDTNAGPSSSPSASHGPSRPAPPAAHKRLPGDDGNLLQALNAYRTGHGRRAVTASVSSAAQLCASSGGAENRCPTPYYWEPVEATDGKAVIDKIVAGSGGAQWLLDPAMSSVQIGWAHGTDGLELCAVIKET